MLYKNKYLVESIRLKDWDYINPWWYYVTINTKNHVEWFGKIENGKMVLNKIGLVANQEWLKTNKLRTNVDLDQYVIMPNHLHGIIVINSVETCRGKSLQEQQIKSEFGKPVKNSLSVIVNQFKGSVKRWANKNQHGSFMWQNRFYDRIIRNEKELFNIRKYIEDNPLKWEIEKQAHGNLDI